MTEVIKDKRAIFLHGEQRRFLMKALKKEKISYPLFANKIGVNTRTFNDWTREEYSLPFNILKRISKVAGLKIPKNIEIRDPFWYVNKGGKVGGLAVYKKYGRIGGDAEYRKKKWYEWWEREGRFKKHPIINVSLPINIPQKSAELAEFIGIVLGDGGITSTQVTITLHKFDDRDFIQYVNNLFQKLFKLKPSIYARKGENVVGIMASRTNLVKFMVSMGLKIGGKVRQQVGVPYWIEKSESFIKSCLRGLFDTDGCFYIDKHRYKDKVYYNCAMNFSNRSLPILFFFKTRLEQLGFHPTRNKKFNISLRKENEIIRYFQMIGSSNLKHLYKYKQYFKNKFGGVPKWSYRSRLESGLPL